MIRTFKVKYIIPVENRNPAMFKVVCAFTRKKAKHEICFFFEGPQFASDIKNGILVEGMRIDIMFWIYSRETITKTGASFWNTFLMVDSWRPYKSGQERKREIVNKGTGEVIKVKY